MAKKITKAIIKETMEKIGDMSKEDCKSFLKTNKIDIGFEKSDFEEISEEDLRNIVIEELELILEDIEDEEDSDDEVDEIEEEVKEEIKEDKTKKDKKELSKPKPKKGKAQQSEPTKKLNEGKAYILEREDGVKIYPTLESKSTNYPIVDSDVKVEIEIGDNTFVAFDDGKYICLQVNGRWSSILGKYMPTDSRYTIIKDGISDTIADFIEDLFNCNQTEADWTPKNTKPQPVKRPKKVKKEGKAPKEDKNQKTLTEMVDETPVVEEKKEVKEIKEDKPKKEKKDKKDKSKKDKSKKDKKASKKTKTTKTSKK